ncbi:MAG: hypothetical protein HY308_04935 [Gammaproteobacteria bacterium]|nr:hypothetical protein [Gammaproteobacteria bacterium]
MLAIVVGTEAVLMVNGFHLTDGLYYCTRFERDLKQLQAKYGVSVATEIKEENYPKAWTTEIVFMPEVVPLENSLGVSQMIHALTLALEKYPPDLIRKEIKEFVLLETLTVNSFPYGGTYDKSTKQVFITRKNNELQESFHHEFSSLLKHAYRFPEQDWKKANGRHFSYRIESEPQFFVKVMHDLVEVPGKEALYQRGLLNFYSETGLENDFNVYAETVFAHPKEMRALIQQYPVIRNKYAVFKTFYLTIDKRFAPVFAEID